MLELELKEKLGAACWLLGDDSGDPVDDERSDDEECIETKSLSVSKFGQNCKSSSRSKDLALSNCSRKQLTEA